MMPRPVFILIRCNKSSGAHFHRILLLSTTAADRHNLVTPHLLRKHQAVMAQPANPHNPHLLPRPGAVYLQWGKGRDPSTKHGRRNVAGQRVWDLENEMTRPPPVIRVSTIALIPIGVSRVIRTRILDLAMLLQPGRAFFTLGLQAAGRLRAHANAIPNLNAFFSFGANAHGVADDFVADNAWVQGGGPAGA